MEGNWLCLPRRRRKLRRRRLILICDVSGSMERYTRMLLHFSHCLTGGLEGVESFLFATAVDANHAPPEEAEDRPGAGGVAEPGARLVRGYQHRAQLCAPSISTGPVACSPTAPVVLLISDGWDRGEPELLRHEVARLQRSCHRLVWLNPLLGAPDYEPLTRGMQAALPFVDDFLPVHNLASLEALAKHLNQLPEHRPARRQVVLTAPVRAVG